MRERVICHPSDALRAGVYGLPVHVVSYCPPGKLFIMDPAALEPVAAPVFRLPEYARAATRFEAYVDFGLGTGARLVRREDELLKALERHVRDAHAFGPLDRRFWRCVRLAARAGVLAGWHGALGTKELRHTRMAVLTGLSA